MVCGSQGRSPRRALRTARCCSGGSEDDRTEGYVQRFSPGARKCRGRGPKGQIRRRVGRGAAPSAALPVSRKCSQQRCGVQPWANRGWPASRRARGRPVPRWRDVPAPIATHRPYRQHRSLCLFSAYPCVSGTGRHWSLARRTRTGPPNVGIRHCQRSFRTVHLDARELARRRRSW